MEALIAVALLVALAVLALRFGAESRPGFGVRANDRAGAGFDVFPAAVQPEPVEARPLPAADSPVIRQLVWAQAHTAGARSRFPTLEAIDLARRPGRAAFATEPDAERLEHCARELTNRYWSEMVWLSGLIDETRFEAVCAELERERTAGRIGILIEPDRTRVAS